jgi:hypothetical protein
MVMNIILNENQYKVLLKYVNNNKKNEILIEQDNIEDDGVEENIDYKEINSEKNALNFAREIEVLKSQKMSGLEYGTYWCKDCSLTTTGTLEGDINFKLRTTDDKQQHGKFCVNKDLYEGKWKCDTGYSLMSVIGKEYGIGSLTKENITKVYNLINRKIPTYKYVDPITKVGKEISKSAEETAKFLYENRHGTLQIIALTSMFIPLIGPAVSFAIELADASLYLAEGEDYDAGLAFAFAMIPGAMLAKKGFQNLTKESLKNISKFYAKGPKFIKLSSEELKLAKLIEENSTWIKNQSLLNAVKLKLKILYKNTKLSKIVEIVNEFKIKNPKKASIFGTGIQIAGVWYTWYELSKIFNIKNKEDRELANELENNFKNGDVNDYMPNPDNNKSGYFEGALKILNRIDDVGEDNKIIET